MTKSLVGLLLIGLISACCASAQSVTGSAQGTVDDDQGQHVGNAYIIATPQGVGGGLTVTTTTGAKGDFTLSGLKPGVYSICVQYPGDPHLDPCTWSTAPQVTIAAGALSALAIPKIVKGSLFVLEIDDPNQLWAQSDDFLVGVALPTRGFYPLRLASKSATARVYDMAVPFNTALVLSISSTHLVFADNKGNVLGHTASIPFKHTAGANNAQLTLTVASRN